ncbi:phage tail protein, partial [Escherichia coli]|nr:phage tail protein [Escherichia coli]
ADNWGSVVSFDASRVVPTAPENRPRSIAFNFIVRAA